MPLVVVSVGGCSCGCCSSLWLVLEKFALAGSDLATGDGAVLVDAHFAGGAPDYQLVAEFLFLLLVLHAGQVFAGFLLARRLDVDAVLADLLQFAEFDGRRGGFVARPNGDIGILFVDAVHPESDPGISDLPLVLIVGVFC